MKLIRNKLFTRTGLTLATVAIVIAGAAAFSAFEAHIVNVTATIENALSVPTTAIDFGTVFPQEHLRQPLSVALSQSFLDESRVNGVGYFIRQKPKCAVTTAGGTVMLDFPTATGHLSVVEGVAVPDCGPAPANMPEGATWGVLPSLCPYISKEADGTPVNDSSTPSFHVPWTVVNGQIVYTDTQGLLDKSAQDLVDTWTIDLAVPTFQQMAAQDWLDFVRGVTGNADLTLAEANVFQLNPADEHKVFGCDLWVEVNNVGESSTPTTTTVEVGPNSLESDLANATTSKKWYFFDDTANVLNNSLGSFVAGPGSPPLGTGSAEVTLADATSRVFLANSGYGGTTLASVNQLDFSDYSHSGVGGVDEAPFVRFNVDFDGTAAYQNSLVYLPSANGSVTKDAWQTWDLIGGGNAKWLYSGANWPTATAGPDFGGPVTAGTTARTWNQILADYPTVRMHPGFPQIGVRFGEPGPAGYVGNTDNFVIGTTLGTTVYDFDN